MSITVVNHTLDTEYADKSYWSLSATSANASGCEELKATPGAGKYLVIREVTICCGSAINVTVGAGESGDAVETVLVGPAFFLADGTTVFTWKPKIPVVLPADKSLTVDASDAGTVTVIVEGYMK